MDVARNIARSVYAAWMRYKVAVLIGVCLLLMTLYATVFFVPKTVAFRFYGDTCTKQLSLLPGVHREVDSTAFDARFEGGFGIGSLKLLSTRTCFSPLSEPKSGDQLVATAPYGGIFARKHFQLVVPELASVIPTISSDPVPATKPLLVTLSKPDSTFSYSVAQGKETAPCSATEEGALCDLPQLKLGQGKRYGIELKREFRASGARTVAELPINTLRAVTVKKSSVKSDQTVYSRPVSFTITTDKKLTAADVELVRTDKKQTIATKTSTKDKTVIITLTKELARNGMYRLTLKSVEARDGSTLVDPKKITFKMSGGPKVVSSSIGGYGVGQNQVVTLQFDQALQESFDINKYVEFSGGAAIVTKQARSVTVSLQGLPRCQTFSITVKKGLPSKYKVASPSAWSQKSRTQCRQIVTYGSSVNGRPLAAHIFGTNGPVTMYVGAIHGNEVSSSGLMSGWVDELEAHPERLKGKRVVVIPTINPDGVAAGTRTNARGVNLSRNFPTSNWTSDIDDTDGRHKGGGGKKPLSEPEASALARITRDYRPRLLLSFHAIGSLVVGDPGGYSAGYAARYASMVGYRDATGSEGTFDYNITGAYEDWTYRNEGIPSMVIELGSYSYYSLPHHRAALWAML